MPSITGAIPQLQTGCYRLRTLKVSRLRNRSLCSGACTLTFLSLVRMLLTDVFGLMHLGEFFSIKHVANCDSSYENQHLISGVALKKWWKMSIPPRLKMLGLRVAWNCLPTAYNLIQPEIMVDNACCFFSEDESVFGEFYVSISLAFVWKIGILTLRLTLLI